MIQRPRYKKWLDEFREKKLIKVLTGLRRSGKSTILDMYVESLKACGVAEDRIVYINFEMLESEPLSDPVKLHKKVLDSLVPGKMTYVFLDEVQHVTEYEKVMDSLYVRDGIDLYITGSTADLLSSEIASRLTGRYVEINVLPLSFKEYVSGRGSTGERTKKGRFLVERIIRYLASNVGSLTSAKRLTDRLAEDGSYRKDGAPAYNTVTSYLERLDDCFFFYKADRFDVRGGEHLKLINKYYLTDFGFKYYILHNPTLELQQIVENVVFFELKRRRYKVSTGKVDDREVDFVVQGDDGRMRYIQVAVSVADEEKLKQELAVFEAIKDNYPKYLLTLDDVFVADHDGIRTLNIIDFLLERTSVNEESDIG